MSKYLKVGCPYCGGRLKRTNQRKRGSVWVHKACPKWKAWEIRSAHRRAEILMEGWGR